jgi:hypothetical protein
MGAAIGIKWKKTEVIPVVLVKPDIGGFVPVEGSWIGNMWHKSDVKAVILVKAGIGGFEPREGSSIGNTWTKDKIVPVMLVEPSTGGFIPLHLLSEEGMGTGTSSAVIESQIDGDFKGWDGETIVKLMNGQIWQQTEYYYHYHYAFMPDVLIYNSGGGWKMKVEGVDKSVKVERFK